MKEESQNLKNFKKLVSDEVSPAMKDFIKEQQGYSEEEVFTLCGKFATFIQNKRPSYKKQLEWFEQFKKK